jgi:hypothetical protein
MNGSSKLVAKPFGRCMVIDLGAGSSAFASRLADVGWDVGAVNVRADRYEASGPFRQLGLTRIFHEAGVNIA